MYHLLALPWLFYCTVLLHNLNYAIASCVCLLHTSSMLN